MPKAIEETEDEIKARISSADSIWLGLDFDGTLTTHTPDPKLSQLLPGNRELLRQLTILPGCSIAIITGRSISDVKNRIDLPDLAYAGNHGLEIECKETRYTDPLAEESRLFLQKIEKKFLTNEWLAQKAKISNKGLTLSIDHLDSDHAATQLIHETVSQTLQLFDDREHAGFLKRLSTRYAPNGIDIRPFSHSHKGTAGLSIVRLQAAENTLPIVIGDDHTDEDLFLAFQDGITICVGHNDSFAEYRAKKSSDVQALLGKILQWRQ